MLSFESFNNNQIWCWQHLINLGGKILVDLNDFDKVGDNI